jgi:hypothetical protein
MKQMSKTNYRPLLLFGALLAGGCSTPEPISITPGSLPYAVQCSNCASQPYYSMMLAQPAIASDFPVAYRVQVPESDARLSQIKPPATVPIRSVGQ